MCSNASSNASISASDKEEEGPSSKGIPKETFFFEGGGGGGGGKGGVEEAVEGEEHAEEADVEEAVVDVEEAVADAEEAVVDAEEAVADAGADVTVGCNSRLPNEEKSFFSIFLLCYLIGIFRPKRTSYFH